MTAILTITLNPALDLSSATTHVVAGPKLRCDVPRVDPGGGGINVARMIRRLGGDSTALIVTGGATGAQLLALLDDEMIRTLPVWTGIATRQNFAITDTTTGAQYRFGLATPPLGPDTGRDILKAIASTAEQDGIVVLSGSLPQGLPVDFPAQIQAALAPRTDRLILDSSGPALTHWIERPARPLELLRLDQAEAQAAAGRPLATVQACLGFALELVSRGVARMVVTGRGADGSLLVTAETRFHCSAPQVPVLSKIGAGDALVGALTLSLSRGEPADQALRWGVAAASATVMTAGTTPCTQQDARDLLPDCIVTPV